MFQKRSKRYDAFIFRQRHDAPLQVAFVAPSSEIDAWSRVPTKQTGNIRNFQRAEIPKHINEVQKFFENKQNASPTAVVVGFDQMRAAGKVGIKDANDRHINPTDVEPGQPIRGTIEICWYDDEDPKGPDALRAAIRERMPIVKNFVLQELVEVSGLERSKLDSLAEQLASRIEEIRAIEFEDEAVEEDGDVDTTDSSKSADSAQYPEWLTESLAGLSPSEAQLVIARLRFLAELDDRNLNADSDLLPLYREVHNELKPGILIDGQHRVMGTKKLGTIPFLVTALPMADWPELAFQFIVTNRTARRVQESLLISIVGNSLSKEQRKNIEERLREANIRVGLIEAVMRVHEDELSPFYGQLAFGLKDEPGFLDAAAMRGKVIQMWYERRPPIRELLDHFCNGRLINEKTEYWKSEEIWFEAFIAFWNAVKERYEGSSVFSFELQDKVKKEAFSKLMSATVLKIFQETVLKNILEYVLDVQQKSEKPISATIPTMDAFANLVRNTLKGLTPDFFVGWQLSGFDGSRGARADLAGAIAAVISNKSTVNQLKKNHRLFKESSAR